MKRITTITFLISSMLVLSAASLDKTIEKTSTENLKFLPKSIQKRLGKWLCYVAGGEFHSHSYAHEIKLLKKDSLYVFSPDCYSINVSSFFIAKKEVTNLEYKEFVSWVKNKISSELTLTNGSDMDLYYPPLELDSSALDGAWFLLKKEGPTLNTSKLIYQVDMDNAQKTIMVYPDTMCWIKDLPYAFMEPYWRHYFNHPAFNEYPVVGISYWQAIAYCQWLTDRINEEVLIANKVLTERSYSFTTKDFLSHPENLRYKNLLVGRFRLPTWAEWEYAATGKSAEHPLYPWGNYLTNEKGRYMANFGPVFDENHIQVKGYGDYKGGPTSVGSYPCNEKGLYDMAGNVAEWVYDDLFEELDCNVPTSNNYQTEVDRQVDSLKMDCCQMMKEHNTLIFEEQYPSKPVKGGSWLDTPMYLIPSTKTIYNENKGSVRIGFRVAFDLNE